MPVYHSDAGEEEEEGSDWSRLLTSLQYANEKSNYLHELSH